MESSLFQLWCKEPILWSLWVKILSTIWILKAGCSFSNFTYHWCRLPALLSTHSLRPCIFKTQLNGNIVKKSHSFRYITITPSFSVILKAFGNSTNYTWHQCLELPGPVCFQKCIQFTIAYSNHLHKNCISTVIFTMPIHLYKYSGGMFCHSLVQDVYMTICQAGFTMSHINPSALLTDRQMFFSSKFICVILIKFSLVNMHKKLPWTSIILLTLPSYLLL